MVAQAPPRWALTSSSFLASLASGWQTCECLLGQLPDKVIPQRKPRGAHSGAQERHQPAPHVDAHQPGKHVLKFTSAYSGQTGHFDHIPRYTAVRLSSKRFGWLSLTKSASRSRAGAIEKFFAYPLKFLVRQVLDQLSQHPSRSSAMNWAYSPQSSTADGKSSSRTGRLPSSRGRGRTTPPSMRESPAWRRRSGPRTRSSPG